MIPCLLDKCLVSLIPSNDTIDTNTWYHYDKPLFAVYRMYLDGISIIVSYICHDTNSPKVSRSWYHVRKSTQSKMNLQKMNQLIRQKPFSCLETFRYILSNTILLQNSPNSLGKTGFAAVATSTIVISMADLLGKCNGNMPMPYYYGINRRIQ